MRAIGLTEFGGPEVLRVIELPDSVPGVGEVRIRVHPVRVAEAVTDHRRLMGLRDQAAQAHRRLAEGGLRGRLVLDFTAF